MSSSKNTPSGFYGFSKEVLYYLGIPYPEKASVIDRNDETLQVSLHVYGNKWRLLPCVDEDIDNGSDTTSSYQGSTTHPEIKDRSDSSPHRQFLVSLGGDKSENEKQGISQEQTDKMTADSVEDDSMEESNFPSK
ncbi:hypothetical protein KGF57_002009 [Candida theae]|uniref:Uncharacterized protein n=1 Tax=Candida theae TaxID=1198502 RepID=A0AAD5FZ91_9ASCO|nr:uncharacterized protein KGF57_002009 [Candida theae]KAI5960009.1 hypothetical protein KGF57_002009 [Candida theae]